jgi:hypothetical protein
LQEGRGSATSQFNDILSRITGQPADASAPAAAGSMMPKVNADGSIPVTSSTPDVSANGSVFAPFIDTVKQAGLTNPYGLAAVAATGKAESGWSPENAGRSWSDPSESGKPGTAGGAMSWRGPRLAALQQYAAKKGEQGNGSPATQAEFFAQEDPQLIAKLNTAKSPEEAQSLMNNAWKFRGYNRPGGEAGRRISMANAYAPQFQGGNAGDAPQPAPVPMSAAAAIEAQAPGSGYVDPTVSAPNYQPPAPQQQAPAPQRQPMQPTEPVAGQFDGGRFGDPIKLAEMPAAQADLQGSLAAQASAYAPQPPQGPANALPPLPSSDVAPTPPVASVPPVQPQQVAQNAAAMPSAPAQPKPYQIDPKILQFLANPFADEGQKAAVRMQVQQQMQQAQQAQEEATWRSRQDYTRQAQNSDPDTMLDRDVKRAQLGAQKNPSRPITADERRQWGIPESDSRPYAMTTEGPKLIGSAGQTINVGGQIEARKQAAEALGLTKDDPRYMGYVLGGDMPKESQQNLTAIDKKAVLDALDQVQAAKSATEQLQSVITPGENGQSLNDRAGSGALADWQAWAARNDPTGLFDDAKGQATTELNNTVLNQALGSLKSIFGAAPTEGERQILLDMQASVDKTPAERKIIIDKAISLAQRRQQFNQERADEIRGNTFYKKQSDPNVQTNAPQTPTEATGMPRTNAAPQPAQNIARPSTEEEFNALPSGAMFIDPDDGKQYRKP